MRPDPVTLLDHLRDPLADPVLDRRRVRLALMMVAMGVLHFVVPGPFRKIVPKWFPWPDEAVAVSGVAEILSGSLMAHPRSQRLGGALATGTLLGVYPANIQMALDATCASSDGSRSRRLAAWMLWLRLPFQAPMVLTTVRVARGR